MYKYGYNHASACMDMCDFVRGPQTHDRVPILLLSLGPGGPFPPGSPKFYDTLHEFAITLPTLLCTFLDFDSGSRMKHLTIKLWKFGSKESICHKKLEILVM